MCFGGHLRGEKAIKKKKLWVGSFKIMISKSKREQEERETNFIDVEKEKESGCKMKEDK